RRYGVQARPNAISPGSKPGAPSVPLDVLEALFRSLHRSLGIFRDRIRIRRPGDRIHRGNFSDDRPGIRRALCGRVRSKAVEKGRTSRGALAALRLPVGSIAKYGDSHTPQVARGRITLGLYNSYDPVRFAEAHRRAIARAAPIALAFDANLATFG